MMYPFSNKFQICLGVALCGLLAGAPTTARAADLNISQNPLFVATNVEPNVMFTLDDSGSMQWEMMPDPVNFAYLFPQANNPYGSGTYGRNIPRFRDNYFLNLRTRNPQLNSVFYNPEITYEPWSRADGTKFPDATPSSALRNPWRPDRGALNLENLNTWTTWSGGGPNDTGDNDDFWPITFFMYDGTGDINSPNNYRKYQIRGNNAFTAFPANAVMVPLPLFTWPDGTVRTVAQEKQNFANWFTYHRSRVLTAWGAIGQAFTRMPDQARVGFAAINKGSTTIDNVATRAVIAGVRDFNLAGRNAFYNSLYGWAIGTSGTPLRRAAQAVGQYFERNDARGPWSTTPGSTGGEDLACRQSFHILMSDGFWNGGDPAGVGNADGTSGPTVTGPDVGAGPQSFTYTADAPFSDTLSNTLGDIGMHYWKRDLRPDLANRVSTTAEDPAFWQHLASFGIALGLPENAPGQVDPDAAFAAIATQTPITWGDPFSSNIAKVNDMIHFGLNGRGGFFTADRPDVFAQRLGDILTEIVARTAATTGISVSTTRLTQDSIAFAAEFDSEDWSGEVKAINVLTGSTIWEAASQVNPSGRKVLTSQNSGTGQTNFTTTMDPALLNRIDGSDITRARDIVSYVRGNTVSGFRPRITLLGDIVNSRPVFAGPGNEGWSRLTGTPGSSYASFVEGKRSGTQAVYIGANDGMLHAFDAGDPDNGFSGGGDELFAFVPRAVMPKLGDLTRDPYDHRFFVDGQQVVRDAYNGGWKRVLVGTLGAGGRGVYAIDVTNPGAPSVLWELTDQEDDDLGFTFGDPIITRLGNGDWVAIFGNGYNSDDNNAVLFVVDLFSGNIRQKLVLEDRSDANGLSGVAPFLDPVSRTFVSRIYAGDLGGTMWRVDFNAGGSASVKYASGLYSDPDGRPITAAPGLAASPAGGVFVYFGTGKLIEPQDRLTSSLRMDRLYAIRDAESRINNSTGLGTPQITESGGQRIITGDGGSDGWVLQLSASGTPTGERVLARATVVFGRVVFTTFEPREDPCAPGGVQRLYLLDALTGEGALDNICPNCGVVEVGIGAPIVPPIIITDPLVNAPGSADPNNPFLPPGAGSLPDSGTVGAVTGWCRVLSTLNPATGQPLPIGPICDGRQVWRQVIDD